MTDHGAHGRFATGAIRVIRARFRMPLPADVWVKEVSTSFPEATLRLLTGVPIGERALELGEVRAEDAPRVADSIRTHPDIDNYEQLFLSDRRALAQYETSEAGLYDFLRSSSLPPEFPVIAENGDMEFDITATREQFEAFGAALDESGRDYELITLVHADDQDPLLTERQRECLAVAQRRGYFDVPRACTLAELAEQLEVDKSTASETIRRATGRIVDQFLLDRW